jgi:hypothetical protein
MMMLITEHGVQAPTPGGTAACQQAEDATTSVPAAEHATISLATLLGTVTCPVTKVSHSTHVKQVPRHVSTSA